MKSPGGSRMNDFNRLGVKIKEGDWMGIGLRVGSRKATKNDSLFKQFWASSYTVV